MLAGVSQGSPSPHRLSIVHSQNFNLRAIHRLSMADPVRDLNNHLQGLPGNLTKYFKWTSMKEGPKHNTIYHVTAVFRDVNIGIGHGSSMSAAKREASTQALVYLKSHVPSGDIRTGNVLVARDLIRDSREGSADTRSVESDPDGSIALGTG